jgi:hypothetical protein
MNILNESWRVSRGLQTSFLVRGPIRPVRVLKSAPTSAPPTHATCSLKSPRVHHAPVRTPPLLPHVPAFAASMESTKAPSAHSPTSHCLSASRSRPPSASPSPAAARDHVRHGRRTKLSPLLMPHLRTPSRPLLAPPAPQPRAPPSAPLARLPLPSHSNRPSPTFRPSVSVSMVRKKKKDPCVRGKQVQGVFCRTSDSYE